jgi:hypothetical protein
MTAKRNVTFQAGVRVERMVCCIFFAQLPGSPTPRKWRSEPYRSAIAAFGASGLFGDVPIVTLLLTIVVRKVLPSTNNSSVLIIAALVN